MVKNLTEKQEQWLNLFFGDAEGDAKKATDLSDYAEGTAPAVIVGALQEEISRRTRELITASGTEAFFSMKGVLTNPQKLGTKEIIAAAKDLMDRAGLAKTDKVEVSATSPLFILPAKD